MCLLNCSQSVADTVIAYSSVGWIESESECFTHPPSLWNKSELKGSSSKEAGRAPDIATVVQMMRKDSKYKAGAKLGFSFELAALAYTMTNLVMDFADSVNAPCTQLFLDHQNLLECRDTKTPTLIQTGYDYDTQRIFMVDDARSLEIKCGELKKSSTFLRSNLAVLLVNSHLGDFTKDGPCAKGNYEDRRDPFYRIKMIKTMLSGP
ncbi:hypothetical protein MRX96_014948 [Rhipicephalus microplus]|uniref:uncharacterized protein LOC142774251 n=1 Tax=Rhipicephalus microplus TaxID=6941 RepID=UPI003F6BB7BE